MRACRFWENIHVQCVKPVVGFAGPGDGIRMCREHLDYVKTLGIQEQGQGQKDAG